jgi:hypothetical protein
MTKKMVVTTFRFCHIFVEILRKTTKTPSQDSVSRERYSTSATQHHSAPLHRRVRYLKLDILATMTAI